MNQNKISEKKNCKKQSVGEKRFKEMMELKKKKKYIKYYT